MTHILKVKDGLTRKYHEIEYLRNGFSGRNIHTGQQEGLPSDAFEIVDMKDLLPQLYVDIEIKVNERVQIAVDRAINDAAKMIVEEASKLMTTPVAETPAV